MNWFVNCFRGFQGFFMGYFSDIQDEDSFSIDEDFRVDPDDSDAEALKKKRRSESVKKYIKSQHDVHTRYTKAEYEQYIRPAIEASGMTQYAFVRAAIQEKIQRDHLAPKGFVFGSEQDGYQVKNKTNNEVLRKNMRQSYPAEYKGESYNLTLPEWSKLTGIAYSRLYQRIRAGVPIQDALIDRRLERFETKKLKDKDGGK